MACTHCKHLDKNGDKLVCTLFGEQIFLHSDFRGIYYIDLPSKAKRKNNVECEKT